MAQEKQILYSKILGDIGNGFPPLLICHGVFGMLDNWQSLGLKFAEHTQVHLLDMRNHGRSFHKKEMNYELMADDLFAYCQHFELESIDLLGHSMGGKVAMCFATKYPAICAKLIVADISPRAYPPHHQSILKGLNSLVLDTTKSRKKLDEHLQEYIPEKGIRQFLLKNVYRKEDGDFALRINLDAITENYEEIIGGGKLEAEYTKKALFLKGSKSDYITQNDELLIQIFFPKAEFESIEAGHWLHAEKPEDFFEKVSKFLFG